MRRFYDTLQRFKTRTLLERIRDPRGEHSTPAGDALTHGITLEQLQGDVLQPGELLLDLFVSPQQTYLFAVSADSCRMVLLPGGHSRLSSQVFLYADLMATSERATRDAYPPARMMSLQQTLGHSLLEPAGDLITAAQHVVVAPDGFFAAIPFGTLILEDGRMLMETRDVVEVPSASVLEWARSSHPATSEAACLVTVDGGGSNHGLKGARRESTRSRNATRAST